MQLIPTVGQTEGCAIADESNTFDYDLALSVAGEDRHVVEELANLLVLDGVRVFYDAYEKSALWGKDLYQHLQTESDAIAKRLPGE